MKAYISVSFLASVVGRRSKAIIPPTLRDVLGRKHKLWKKERATARDSTADSLKT